MGVYVQVVTRSDAGKVRAENEDYASVFRREGWTLLVLCDGMGGVKGGKTASRLAVASIGEYFEKNFQEPTSFFREATAFANKVLRRRAAQEPELADMGTTAVMVLYNETELYYAHVGDSRLYLFRKGELKQLTRDHSYVAGMLERGLISPEEARAHKARHKITRCIGSLNSEPEIAPEPVALQAGDLFLLCSDGLTDMVPEEQIAEILSTSAPPEDLAEQLIHEANRKGGKDNITVQIVQVAHESIGKSVPGNVRRKKRSRMGRFSLTLVLLFLLGLMVGYGIRQHSRAVRSGSLPTALLPDSLLVTQANPDAPPRECRKVYTYLFGVNRRNGLRFPEWLVQDTVFSFNYFIPAGLLITYASYPEGMQAVISSGAPPMPNLEGKEVTGAVDSLVHLGFGLVAKRGDSLIFRFAPDSMMSLQFPGRWVVYATSPGNREPIHWQDLLILIVGPALDEPADSSGL